MGKSSLSPTTVIRFTVLGVPQSRGSKRAFPFHKRNGKLGVAVSDNNPKSRDWMNSVKDAAREAYDGQLWRGPVVLNLRFIFPRPKCHFGTGRNANLLKASAPMCPAGKPDLLKLARSVEDALSGVVYVDDGQIVRETLSKYYGEPARVEIQIADITAIEVQA